MKTPLNVVSWNMRPSANVMMNLAFAAVFHIVDMYGVFAAENIVPVGEIAIADNPMKSDLALAEQLRSGMAANPATNKLKPPASYQTRD